MIVFDYKERIIKFVFCSIVLIMFMFILSRIFYVKENKTKYNEVVTSKINYHDNLTSVYAEYPRFNGNEDVNRIISDNLYKYIRDFKSYKVDKALDITYNLFYIDNFVNVQYHIENTLNDIKNKNVLIDLENNKISYITSIYDEEKLSNELYEMIKEKYSDLYDKITSDTINNYTYIFDEDKINVYFNNIETIPYVSIDKNINYQANDNNNLEKKYIAFTYDDGPSDNTLKLLDILESNNSSATFFMIGNKMKGNENIIKSVYNSSSEIGAHSYSHKSMSNLSEEEIVYELNSTNFIFNEITNDKLKLFRPPYGKYNNLLLSKNYQIITWNIDTKDWLLKDKNKIYNAVVDNACDGCIVLMHDNYDVTVEATQMIIPTLKEYNYEIVSVSKLMQIKNFNYNNEVVSFIK